MHLHSPAIMAMLLHMATILNLTMIIRLRPTTMQAHEGGRRSDAANRGRAVADTLVTALGDAGWQVRLPAADRGLDALAHRQRVTLAIEVKGIAEGRADRLIPLWSQTWLQAQRAARAGEIPVAVVGADRIAPKAADAVLAFIAEVAPDASGGVIDRSGLRRFRGTHLEDLDAEPVLRPRRSASPKVARGTLFTDLGQWMLKVLLAPGIPASMLEAPRARYRGATELAAAADVSVMSASRLLQDLRRDGYLDEDAPDLRLVRVRHLLERWQAAVSAQPVEEQPCRALLRGRADSARDAWLAEDAGCLALFAAARAHGLGLVEGVPAYVYARHATDAPPGFAPAGPGDVPDLIVRRPRALQSVFRGMVQSGKLPASDIVQTWLDVANHPARGREQAELIWRKVLAPLCDAQIAL